MNQTTTPLRRQKIGKHAHGPAQGHWWWLLPADNRMRKAIEHTGRLLRRFLAHRTGSG